jgi:hypothetical protein
MKRNVLLGLAGIGIATAFTAPAQAGVSFGIHIGFPLPPLPAIVVAPPCPPRVVIPPPPVYPAPVVIVRPPVPFCPPPVVVACPPPVVVAYPAPVVVSHPHFIPPGHAKRYGYGRVEYRHPGRGHGHH